MKQIEKILEDMTRLDMSYTLRSCAEAATLLQLYRPQLEAFFERKPEATVEINSSCITLQSPERHELIAFLECFGGDWKKEVNIYDSTKMDYVQEHLHPLRDKSRDFDTEIDETTGEEKKVPYKYQRKLIISVSAVAPPPSCQIVEEEVEIPARRELRKKIVCKEPKEVEA